MPVDCLAKLSDLYQVVLMHHTNFYSHACQCASHSLRTKHQEPAPLYVIKNGPQCNQSNKCQARLSIHKHTTTYIFQLVQTFLTIQKRYMVSYKPKKNIKQKEPTTTTTVPSSKTTLFDTNLYPNIFGKTTRHTAQ